MTVTNETRRQVMTLAWQKFRFERFAAPAYTFAAALRHAWGWVKGAAARSAAELAWNAVPAKRVLRLSPSLIRTAIGNATSTRRHPGFADTTAACLTSRICR